jgi:peptide/nickel transport system permease protein
VTTPLGVTIDAPAATRAADEHRISEDSASTPPSEKAPRSRLFRRRPPFSGQLWVGVAMLAVVLIGAIIAAVALRPSYITPDILTPPGGEYLFGTDSAGRDLLARTLAAALADLPLALGSTAIAAVAGTALGLLASAGGRVSEPIMRIVDGFQAFPTLILVLVVVQVTGGGTAVLLVTLAALNMPRFIRLTRTEAMQVASARYVFFARVIGAKPGHVLRRHVLPNVSGAILSQASISAAISLSAIGAMSFLGLGIAPPTPSWGAMIQLGASGMTIGQWWPVVFPCLALVWSIVAFNLVADSLDTHFARESK